MPALARACVAVAAVLLASRASAQAAPARPDSTGVRPFDVRILGAAPGISGDFLRDALNGPHVAWRGVPGGKVRVPRDSAFAHTLVVAGGTAFVQSRVKGDVIVAGGDLELGPGARIEGRAIAIGGVVKHSPWAFVRDTSLSYPQHHYDLQERDGRSVLHYRRQSDLAGQLFFELPGYYGWQELSYDRVQSVGIQWGPELALQGSDVLIQPVIGWHAQQGNFDPGLHVRLPFGTVWRLDLDGRRETRTNEAWIASTLDNTATTFIFGQDVRNYYRAWRGEAVVSRPIEFFRGHMTMAIGGAWERAWSLATPVPALPSIIGQSLLFSNRRLNPAITDGDIASGVLDLTYEHTATTTPWSLGIRTEVPFQTVGAARWVQNTVTGTLLIPTVGTQYWHAKVRAVITSNGPAPGQRQYGLGGPASMTTRDILDRRGDQLLFVEHLYTFPIERWDDPLWGTPKFSLRHVLGGAAVGGLGTLSNEVGVRFDFAVLRSDIMFDPESRRVIFSFAAAIGP
ncbi:MAG: hypothetical protein HY275_19680 [Gemmatimonadetes bacterium]|nr:hypothetical protein [Gemmatimonadota bacterium]